jgi:hypothetical protein
MEVIRYSETSVDFKRNTQGDAWMDGWMEAIRYSVTSVDFKRNIQGHVSMDGWWRYDTRKRLLTLNGILKLMDGCMDG